MRRALLWLRSVLLKRRLEREMQVEMAEHIERATDRLVARGLSREAARRQALREFGNIPYIQEEGRIARGTRGMDTLLGDLRFAVRHFAREPLSTLTIVAVLSIGISINVVLYTMVHSVTDRPPSGVEASDELVRVRGSQLAEGSRKERALSLGEVEGYRALDTQFSSVAAWTSQPVTAAAPGVEDFTVTATFVTDEYFTLLGVHALRGRGIGPGDPAQLAVLSHATWERSFGLDPNIVGRTITLADVPFTIVGVTPPRFRGAAWEARNDMQIWLPLASHVQVFPGVPQNAPLFSAIARLAPGATRESAGPAARVAADRIAAELRNDAADDSADALPRDPSVEVAALLADNLEPGAEEQLQYATLAFSVLGLLTLLVTCANVGALQTGLALARRREIAIRMSLGAHRSRVIRQLVTESLLLALFAAVGSVALTLLIIRAILGIVGALSFELVFDRSAIAFAFAVALLAGLLFGLSPALHATRLTVAGALKESAGAIAGGRGWLQRSLVVAQIALTQPLAVCLTTVVAISAIQYRSNPPNPNGERIVQLRLAAASGRELAAGVIVDTNAAKREQLDTERLVAALRGAPGITSAAFVPSRVPIKLEAFTLPRTDSARERRDASFYLAGRASMPGFLELVGTPIVLGRDLSDADTAGIRARSIPIVIGDDMARTLWGDTSPIGRRVVRASTTAPISLEVVGVYRSPVTAQGHARNPFSIYVPRDSRLTNAPQSRLIFVRIASGVETILPTIRRIVRAEAPRGAITELRTLASAQDEERFILTGGIALFSSAGLVVLLLCALGLYAVIAFSVGQRTREIAVRMAIGAQPRQIVGRFAADGIRLTAVGIVVGLPLSIVGVRELLSLSPEVPEVSLSLIVTVVVIGVGGVAALASWIPARRAAAVEPAAVLSRE